MPHQIPSGVNLQSFFRSRGIDIDALLTEAREKVADYAHVRLSHASREVRVSYSEIIIEETVRRIMVNAYHLAQEGKTPHEITKMVLAQKNINWKFTESLRMHGPKKRYGQRSVEARRETDLIYPHGSDMRGLPDKKDARESMMAGMPAPDEGRIHADTLRKIRRSLDDREWTIFKARMRGETNKAIAARLGVSESAITLMYQKAQSKIEKRIPELKVHRRTPTVQPKRRRRSR